MDKADIEKENVNKKKVSFLGLVEMYIWILMGIVSYYIFGPKTPSNNITYISITIIVSFLIPFLFKLVFSRFPLEYLREKYLKHGNNIDSDFYRYLIYDNELNTQKILLNDIIESKNNADRLFSQSRSYLFVGCVISIFGVIIFFFLNNYAIKITEEQSFNFSDFIWIKLIEYLPRFGILFFIEYIAFFFLKQYRILMEEYRYYEAIKRERQDILSVYLILKDRLNDIESLKMLMNYLNEHSAKVPYITGSHKIKTEKMLNEDMDFISKLTTLIQTIKTPDKTKE